jgi:phosphatidylserine/phosphatidylglycerophosphate/cardiolipin synthase-like enzyme
MEASVLAAQPDVTLRLPVYEKDGFKTGVAFVNLAAVASSISLTLRASDGTPLPAVNLSLTPSQQFARFVSEMFPSVSNFEGTLEISAAYPVAALALRQNISSGIFSTLPVSPQSTETYFSPRGGVSARIVQEIERANTSIDVEIYSFTRDEIADALIAAKNRGVTVRILADTSEATIAGSDIARLEAAGIPLKRTNGGGGGIMHNKAAIFDRRILLTGSYNWSNAAEQSNDENAIFIRTPSVIAAYQSIFDNL